MTTIGLLRAESGWEWSDGSAVDYINWMPGEPSNSDGVESCVQVSGTYVFEMSNYFLVNVPLSYSRSIPVQQA